MPFLKLDVFKLLLMSLMLSGCSGFPTRPSGHIYNVDSKSGVAYKMSIPQKSNQDFKFTGEEVQLKMIDKYFCVSPEYLMKLQFWMDDVRDYSEEKCGD